MTRAVGPSCDTDVRLSAALWAWAGRDVVVRRVARVGYRLHPFHATDETMGTLTHVRALSRGRFVIELDHHTKLPCGGREFPSWQVTPVEAWRFVPTIIA